MKTSRLVIGILSIVLFLIISLQSCAVGIGNTLQDNGEVSGSAGVCLLSLFYLNPNLVQIQTCP